MIELNWRSWAGWFSRGGVEGLQASSQREQYWRRHRGGWLESKWEWLCKRDAFLLFPMWLKQLKTSEFACLCGFFLQIRGRKGSSLSICRETKRKWASWVHGIQAPNRPLGWVLSCSIQTAQPHRSRLWNLTWSHSFANSTTEYDCLAFSISVTAHSMSETQELKETQA